MDFKNPFSFIRIYSKKLYLSHLFRTYNNNVIIYREKMKYTSKKSNTSINNNEMNYQLFVLYHSFCYECKTYPKQKKK